MCLYPTLINNRKYIPNKKNGGNPPPITDKRVKKVPIGCQQCIECRKQKARGWQVRLLEDIRHNKNGKFITLTFSNESIWKLNKEIDVLYEGYDRDREIATLATRRFLERWRKQHGKSLRHWLVTEIGHNGTENIHLHGIIWTNESMEEVEKHWQYGYIWKGQYQNGKLINYVNEQTVNYITKYVYKVDESHKSFKATILTSPGIGKGYTSRNDSLNNKYNETKTNETYRTRTGHKIALPIYWRNKIYTEPEREKLWLQRLDKNERWICGERISIANGETEYYELLEYYRKHNSEMGYGNGQISWDRQQYENQRRELKLGERLAKAEQKRTKNKKEQEKPEWEKELRPGETYYEFKHVNW